MTLIASCALGSAVGFRTCRSAMMTAAEGFNTHVPLEERIVDATWMDGMRRWKKALRHKLPFCDAPDDGPRGDADAHVPMREQLAAAYEVVRSQIPGTVPPTRSCPL